MIVSLINNVCRREIPDDHLSHLLILIIIIVCHLHYIHKHTNNVLFIY